MPAVVATPDNVYIGLYFNQTFGVGTNQEIAANWILKGTDRSFVPYLTLTSDGTAGYDVGVGVIRGAGYDVGRGDVRAEALLGPRVFGNGAILHKRYLRVLVISSPWSFLTRV